MNKKKIFGVEVLAGTKEELFTCVGNMIGEGGAVSTVNPEILYDSLQNEALHSALCDSLCVPDGVGVEKTLLRMGAYAERFAGVELGEALISVFSLRLGIIGGEEGVAERAMENLSERYASLTPVFARSGYNINNEEFKKTLTETKPDVVFVCLGSPKQELFIAEMKRFSKETVFLGLGGSVDIYAGDKKRAPKILRQLKLEWLYRMITEPKRIKRAPKLLFYVLKNKKYEKSHKKTGKIGKKRKKSV